MNAEINGPAAACIAGLITSLHCLGMCGPISCAACLRHGSNLAAVAGYHAARVASYALAGAAAGAAGRLLVDRAALGPLNILPWLFIAFFLLVALGLDKRAGRAVTGFRLLRPVFSAMERLGAVPAGLLLGAITPLLPCGPLYILIGAAALSGTAAAGALLMAAFGAGTVPLHLALHAQLFRLGRHFSPSTLEHLRRGLAVVSAALLLLRVMQTGSMTEAACPMCR